MEGARIDEGNSFGDVVALGGRRDVEPFCGRAHIVDPQVKCCSGSEIIKRRDDGHAPQIVEERRDHAAMDDARSRICNEMLAPDELARDLAALNRADLHADFLRPWYERDDIDHILAHRIEDFLIVAHLPISFPSGPAPFDGQVPYDRQSSLAKATSCRIGYAQTG